MSQTAFAISWYRPGDWDSVKQLFPDGADLHDTYAEWLASAEQVEREMAKQGVRTERVEVRPWVFLEWCRANKLRPDGKARSRYAREMLRKRDQLPF